MNVAEYKLSKDSARPMVRMNYVDAVLPDDIAKLLINADLIEGICAVEREPVSCCGAGRNTFDRGSARTAHKNDLVPSPGKFPHQLQRVAFRAACPASPPEVRE
jgi:hypothetical protein